MAGIQWGNPKIAVEKVRDNTIPDTIDCKKIKSLVILENLVNTYGKGNWKICCFKFNLKSEFVRDLAAFIESGELKSAMIQTANKYSISEIQLLKGFFEDVKIQLQGDVNIKIEENY